MNYVNEWPERITTPHGIIYRPSPEQCREYGYELAENKPQAMKDAEAQAAQQAADEGAARVAHIEALRGHYREAVGRFCQLAGLPVVSKFEDETAIETAINAANSAGDLPLSLALTQLALAIQNAITELRRKDGDDAWARI